jgi:hypothetical protein
LYEDSALGTRWQAASGGLPTFGHRSGWRTRADRRRHDSGDDEHDDDDNHPRRDAALPSLETRKSFHVDAPAYL